MLPQKGTYGQGGWPDNGEVDIMEHVGFDPEIVHASVHTRAYNHVDGTQRTAQTPVAGAQDDFHVYAVEWTTDRVRAFVDGRDTSVSQTNGCRIRGVTGASGRSIVISTSCSTSLSAATGAGRKAWTTPSGRSAWISIT